MGLICWIVLLLFFFCIAWLVLPQIIIYRPSAYPEPLVLEKGVEAIRYTTPQGRQMSFCLPATKEARHHWMLFSGNNSRALEWLDVLRDIPRTHTTFVLYEYPGFGKCKGAPSPESIAESSLALASRFPSVVSWNVVGFSLGGATALQFVAQQRTAKAIIISTFTSIRDMAQRLVGALAQFPIAHNFNNRQSLRKILKEKRADQIHLLHGDQDCVVPVCMGRALRDEFFDIVTYHEIRGAGHNDMLSRCHPQLMRLMAVE